MMTIILTETDHWLQIIAIILTEIDQMLQMMKIILTEIIHHCSLLLGILMIMNLTQRVKTAPLRQQWEVLLSWTASRRGRFRQSRTCPSPSPPASEPAWSLHITASCWLIHKNVQISFWTVVEICVFPVELISIIGPNGLDASKSLKYYHELNSCRDTKCQ